MSKVVHNPRRRTEHGTRSAWPAPPVRKPLQVPPAWLAVLLKRRKAR